MCPRAPCRANGAGFDVTEATVLVAVAQAYFAAAGADELAVARRHAVEVARLTFDNAKARVAAEVANQVDVTRAETALVRAEQDRADQPREMVLVANRPEQVDQPGVAIRPGSIGLRSFLLFRSAFRTGLGQARAAVKEHCASGHGFEGVPTVDHGCVGCWFLSGSDHANIFSLREPFRGFNIPRGGLD